MFLNRYDPVAALLTSLALVALLRGQERAAGALLGAGTAIKLYPVVFLPIAARRVRSLAGAGGAYLIAGAVFVLPFFALAPGGVGYSLWTQLRRHLQIESLGASILLVVSKLGIHHVGWIDGKPGSIDLGGLTADAVGVISSVVSRRARARSSPGFSGAARTPTRGSSPPGRPRSRGSSSSGRCSRRST